VPIGAKNAVRPGHAGGVAKRRGRPGARHPGAPGVRRHLGRVRDAWGHRGDAPRTRDAGQPVDDVRPVPKRIRRRRARRAGQPAWSHRRVAHHRRGGKPVRRLCVYVAADDGGFPDHYRRAVGAAGGAFRPQVHAARLTLPAPGQRLPMGAGQPAQRGGASAREERSGDSGSRDEEAGKRSIDRKTGGKRGLSSLRLLHRSRLALGLALVVAALAALPVMAHERGITPTEIILGTTAPLSGPAAPWGATARGIEAYLQYINEQGGIHGRTIRFEIRDDGYQPPRAVANVLELVERVGVFGIVGMIGSANAAAVRDYIFQNEVIWMTPAVESDPWIGNPNIHYLFVTYPNYYQEAK